jgi:hypothetical protein
MKNSPTDHFNIIQFNGESQFLYFPPLASAIKGCRIFFHHKPFLDKNSPLLLYLGDIFNRESGWRAIRHIIF